MFHWRDKRGLVAAVKDMDWLERRLSASEELMMRQMRRMDEFRNSAIGRLHEEALRRAAEHDRMIPRHLADYIHELGHWQLYQDLIRYGVPVRKVVKTFLQHLASVFKQARNSFGTRICATLKEHSHRTGIVKALSPPIRLVPKSLHPIDSVAP